MVSDYRSILGIISRYTVKPPLFAPGEPVETHFWDDVHISKGMLDAHLDPMHESASRRPETIDREVNHLVSPGLLKKGDKVLDLGCGPGLYSVRLAAKDIKVTGIDISERSLNYAIAQARKYNLDIEYRLLNFFDLDYKNEFDAAIQVFGEMGTFSDEKRDILLGKIHSALKPGGLFIFDVTTPALKQNPSSQNHWYMADAGFWRPGRHLTLELRFDYPEVNVFVNQYIVIDEEKLPVYRIWNHNYTPEMLRPVLEKAGFRLEHTWNSLSGTPYRSGSEWLAAAARKR